MSEVSVTITGLPFSEKAVTGVSIDYGVNSIPTATLSLDMPYIQQNSPDILCNPDNYKRRSTACIISIKSKTGCHKFYGYFDGINAYQGVGGLAYSAVIKNIFIRLTEVFPKFPGVSPGSVNPFNRIDLLTVDKNNEQLRFSEAWPSVLMKNNENYTLGQFIVGILGFIVSQQLAVEELEGISNRNKLNELMRNVAYVENAGIVKSLLDQVDTSFISESVVKADYCAPELHQLVVGTTEVATMWELLLRALAYVGCNVVIGGDKLFVVPQACYLKFGTPPTIGNVGNDPSKQEFPQVPNVAYPVVYDNLSIDDNGFINVGHVFVTGSSSAANVAHCPDLTYSLGVYPDEGQEKELADDGSTGIALMEVDQFFFTGLSRGYLLNKTPVDNISAGKFISSLDEINEPNKEDMVKQIRYLQDEIQGSRTQQLLNNYAKARFMEIKYKDRTGMFSGIFNPNWVVGSTGCLFSRLPGMYYNFFVTSVTHSIKLSAPNQGAASTQVSFNTVRSAGSPAAINGLDKDDLYQYTTEKMKQFQQRWCDTTL